MSNNKPNNQIVEQDRHMLVTVCNKLRDYQVDKYAKIVGTSIEYSLYDHKTRRAKRMKLTLDKVRAIFNDLYPTEEN